MVLSAVDENLAEFYGPSVIAIYTADTNGNLTTASTYKTLTIPETGIGSMSFSPSGKLFAVGGAGLEIFHFTGSNPLTEYKTILTGNGIGQIFWDNDNHMYALGSDSKGDGKLWVYTVTATSVTEAPGSPYSIANPGGLHVQPLN
jgi:WD40 repeat protein